MKHFYHLLAAGALLASGSLSTLQAGEGTWNYIELQKLQPVMAPEGNAQAYQFYSMGYSEGDFYEDSALATSIILTENEIYIKNPLFDYTTNAWIKGKREGNKAIFTFPQTLGTFLHQNPETYAYEYAPIYLFVCKAEEVVIDEENSFWTMALDTDNQVLEMEIAEDGTISWGNPDPKYMSDLRGIGAYTGEDDDMFWTKAAELYDKFTPLSDINDAPPAAAKVEKWNYRDSYEYHVVNVATEGTDLWIENPAPNVDGGWLKGTVAGSQVTFNSGQFIGVDDNYRRLAFFMGGKEAKIYTGDEEEYYMGSKPQDNVVLSYDAAAKSISSEDGTDQFLFLNEVIAPAVFENNPDLLYYHMVGQVKNPYLYLYEDLGMARPANPEILSYDTYTYTGWGGTEITEVELLFATPNKDLNGQAIPVDDCYYRLFVNGELFSLYNDEYLLLPKELDGISDIPYTLHENYGLFTHSLVHDIYMTSEGISTIGIQGFCKAPDGKVYESDLITLDLSTGETHITAGVSPMQLGEGTLQSVEYYTLQGQRIQSPRPGEVYIMRGISNDGKVKTSKMIQR